MLGESDLLFRVRCDLMLLQRSKSVHGLESDKRIRATK